MAGPILAIIYGMKTVIIVSKCLRVTKFDPQTSWYEFHFKGVFAGEAIKKVMLLGSQSFSIKKGEEYLMYVKLLSCEQGLLKGTILKAKILDECWDKS